MDDKKELFKKISSKYLSFFALCSLIIVLSITKIYQEKKIANSTITLTVPSSETIIFLDDTKKRITTKEDEEVVLSASEGTHRIIAYRDDSWQWSKDFVVTQKNDQRASVFTVKKNPTYSLVPEYTLEDGMGIQNNTYKKILSLFDSTTTRAVSKSGLTEIQTTANRAGIVVTWNGGRTNLPNYFCEELSCDTTFLLLPNKEKIGRIGFYKGQEDKIIFSSDTTIWVMELGRDTLLNVQPLYVGIAPDFADSPENSLYVKDAGDLLLINL